jgi:hypothetical protein
VDEKELRRVFEGGSIMNGQPRICDKCKGLCKELISKHNPSASEWYCEKCHKSYPYFVEEPKEKVN